MFDAISSQLVSWAYALIQLFPASPLADVWSQLAATPVMEWMGWLNWFIPVGKILGILSVWLTAVSAYYVYQIVLRWIKVIE